MAPRPTRSANPALQARAETQNLRKSNVIVLPLPSPPPSLEVEARISVAGRAAAIWGVAGVCLLLGSALWRLVPVAHAGLTGGGLGAGARAFLIGWLGFMAYFEGYRGFQRGFAPRVVSRAKELLRDAGPVRSLLAPLYCMGLILATRRRMVTSWCVTTGIVLLVVLVRHVAQPWRGIIDAGVVLGLAWGLAAIVAFAWSAAWPRRSVVADAPDLCVDELRAFRRLQLDEKRHIVS